MAIRPAERSVEVSDRRSYKPHEVEAGLQALVVCGGSSRMAAREVDVPRSTLEKWSTVHRARIEEIRRERGPELERMAIEGFRAFVVRAEQVKAAALELTLQQIEDGSIKDPARAMQAVSISQGISVQRMLELDGRPSGVAPDRSLGELVAALERLGATKQSRGSVEGSAVELPATEGS